MSDGPVSDDPVDDGTASYCVHCGRAAGEPCRDSCAGARAALEPARFCPHCARRMVVQVTPSGWVARCSRHGELTSNP